MDMTNETQQKISQLQMLEQNMQTFLVQKQQIQSQLVEIDSALKELEKAEKSYKIIGNIMVSSDRHELETDLKNKKEMLEIKLKSIEKQEGKIREKSQSLQSDVLASMKDEEKNQG